jgi:hypothetical protein
MRLETSLCAKLATSLTELGLKGKSDGALAVSNYQKLLKNPIYTGLMRYNGEIYEGKARTDYFKETF